MMKKLFLFILFSLLLGSSAFAQEGVFSRSLCTEILSPVTNKTFCFETTGTDAGKLKVWNGSTWSILTGSGSFDEAGNYTLTGSWTFDTGSSVDLSAATFSLDHGQLTGLTSGDPHTQYVFSETSAGAPAAGSCDRDGQLITDTTNNVPYFCSDSAGGNPRSFGTLGDAFNQATGDTGAVSASGNETLRFEGSNGITTTATAGSPDKVTIANAAKITTKSITFRIGSDGGSALADSADELTIWRNNIAAMTIVEVWCESDAGSPIINLQRDDGSAANILSSNLTCTTSGATGSIAGAEDNLAVGDKIDFVMVTAGGTAKRVTISIKATID